MDHLTPEPARDEPAPGTDPAVDADRPGFEGGAPDADHTASVSDDTAAPDAGAPDAAAAARARRRWLIGGAVAFVAIAAGIWAAFVLSARPLPQAFGYVPADSVVVAEFRPDLPGDQRAHLGAFLAHFPGFADQSSLPAKLDESLDRLVRQASGGTADYARDVKPLLAGAIVLAVPARAVDEAMSGDSATAGMVVFTTDGDPACEGAASETYRGIAIVARDGGFACATHDRFLLVGDVTTVHDAIDARLDGTSIATSRAYLDARAWLEGDQLATMYVDGAVMGDALGRAAPDLGVAIDPESLPAVVMAGLRMTDDALVVDLRSSAIPAPSLDPSVPTAAPAHAAHFAATLPASTLGYLELHGVGAGIARGLAALSADPAAADALGGALDQLNGLGGLDSLVGWIDDFAVAVVPGETQPGVIVALGGPAADVSARYNQLRGILTLATIGTDMTVTDEPHGDVTITRLDLGDLGSLSGLLGLPLDAAPTGRLELDLASAGDALLIGVGPGAIEAMLDTDPTGALATTPTYRAALPHMGSPTYGELYLAVDRVLAWLDASMPDATGAIDAETRAYLEHLGAIGVSATRSSGGGLDRFFLTVK